jgi:predicted peptidase
MPKPSPARALSFLATVALPLALASGCAPHVFVPDAKDGFHFRTDAGHKHYVYVPTASSPEKKLPVIIYLHGGGEMGDDGVKPTQVGLGPVVWRSHGTFQYIVLFPQCRRDGFWAFPDMDARVMESLANVLAEFHGDPDRVYLTGNSMGGYGTWLIAARHPDVFAALVPIAGGVRPPRGMPIPKESIIYGATDPEAAIAEKLGRIPVWAFHGAKDWLVKPENSRRLVEAMKKNGGDVRYSELPGVGHNAEDTAYVDPALFEWLAQQKRAPKPGN